MRKGFMFTRNIFADNKRRKDMREKYECNKGMNDELSTLESKIIRTDVCEMLNDGTDVVLMRKCVNDSSETTGDVSEEVVKESFKSKLRLRNIRKDLKIEIIYGMAGVGKTHQLAQYVITHPIGTYRVLSPTHSALNTIYNRCLELADGKIIVQDTDFRTVHSYFQIAYDSTNFVSRFDPNRCTSNDETIFIDEFSLINKYLFRNCFRKINSSTKIKKVVLCGDIMQLNAVYDCKLKIGFDKMNRLNDKWCLYVLQRSRKYNYCLNELNKEKVLLYEGVEAANDDSRSDANDENIFTDTSNTIDDVMSSLFTDDVITDNAITDDIFTEPSSTIDDVMSSLFTDDVNMQPIYTSSVEIDYSTLFDSNTTVHAQSVPELSPAIISLFSNELSEISSNLKPNDEIKLKNILKTLRPNNNIFTWSLYPNVLKHYHLSITSMNIMKNARKILLKTNKRSKNNVLQLLNALYSYDYDYPYKRASYFDLKRLISDGYIFIGANYDTLRKVYDYTTIDGSSPLIDLERDTIDANIQVLMHFNKHNAEIERVNNSECKNDAYSSIRFFGVPNQKNPFNVIQLTYNNVYICTINDPNGNFRNGDELRFKGFCLEEYPNDMCENDTLHTKTSERISAKTISYMYSLRCENIYTKQIVYIPLSYVSTYTNLKSEDKHRFNRMVDEIIFNKRYVQQLYENSNDKLQMTLRSAFYPIAPNNIITFHRSQGKTIENVIICIDNTFDVGMIYTGITRAVNNVMFYTKYNDKLQNNKDDFCDLLFKAANVTEFVQLKLLIENALDVSKNKCKNKSIEVVNENITELLENDNTIADMYADLDVIKGLFV